MLRLLPKRLIQIGLCAILSTGPATALHGASAQITPSADTHRAFERRAAILPLDSVKNFTASKKCTPELREIVEWMYAYMPTADILNYPLSYHIGNAESALRARNEMPWGAIVPEREFRYFVLPQRVNNEALDGCRPVFYEELAPRLSGMSMTEAALEVNHWCHEKATYRPSDPRTSTPLSTVSQAIGRCGEESTFTVAALRSVGIPARQVYTPRWAHTDDNHAWVEFWADGKWHFLGACEPEPVADLAWFNAPASRGMLMNTRISGHYDGPEEVLDTTTYTTQINVTENYAPTGKCRVKVIDAFGEPLEGVRVDYCLYNYAMPYPIGTRKSDANGETSLLTGLGDAIAWASDGVNYDYGIVNPERPLVLSLSHTLRGRSTYEFKVTPPAPGVTLPAVTPRQREANDRRLAYEDSLRHAYTATFADSLAAFQLALKTGLNDKMLCNVMPKTRGNHKRIAEALGSYKENWLLLDLMSKMEEKDLRDVDPEVLIDHLKASGLTAPTDIEMKYVISPRIEWEQLTAWRTPLKKALGNKGIETLRKDPQSVAQLIASHVKEDDGLSARGAVINPWAAWKAGIADKRSARILAVALLRTAGVPSRIDPVSGRTQFFNHLRQWQDFTLEAGDKESASEKEVMESVPVKFAYTPNGTVESPKYWSHFTLSSLEGGYPDAFDFGDFTTIDEINAEGHSVPAGPYMLMSGQRLADGSVLVHSEILQLTGSENLVSVTIPTDTTAIQVIGSFDSETPYHDLQTGADKSILSTTGRGYYVLIMGAPSNEPTAHVLNEISGLASEFERDGRKILLLFGSRDAAARFDRSLFGHLPENMVIGADIDNQIYNALTGDLNLPESDQPYIIVADTFNRVVFKRHGYTIGTAEALLRTLSQLK